MRLTSDALYFTQLDKPASRPPRAIAPNPKQVPLPTRGVNLKFSFDGANRNVRLEPFNRASTHISYFQGKTPNQWHADVPVWSGVRYVDLYPGLDLEVISVNGRWQPKFVVRTTAGQAALSAVHLRVDGANTVALQASSQLSLTTAIGNWGAPLLQVVKPDGSPFPLIGLAPSVVGNIILQPFAPPTTSVADATFRLLSDPFAPLTSADLQYATYLGGGDYDKASGMTADLSGAVYVLGWTFSADFPITAGAFTPNPPGFSDLWVSKSQARW